MARFASDAVKGRTIKQLLELQKSGFYNGDTGTEIDPEQGRAQLHEMLERRSTLKLNKMAKEMSKTRSRGRPMIPAREVIFRRINGRIVPFRRPKEEPFL